MTSFSDIRAKYAARRQKLKDPDANAKVLHRLLHQIKDTKPPEDKRRKLLLVDVEEQAW